MGLDQYAYINAKAVKEDECIGWQIVRCPNGVGEWELTYNDEWTALPVNQSLLGVNTLGCKSLWKSFGTKRAMKKSLTALT